MAGRTCPSSAPRRALAWVFDGKPTRTAGSVSDRGPAAHPLRPVRQAACHSAGHDAVRLFGHDDRRDLRRVRRARDARRISHVRAAVDRSLPRRRGALPAWHAPASQEAAEPAVRRRKVPRRPGRRPGRISRLRGDKLVSDRGGDAHPGHADERGRAVCHPHASARHFAAATRAAGCRRVRRAVPLPRPVHLPLRRPPDRRRRSGPRLRGHRNDAARWPTRGGVAGRPGPQPARRNRPPRTSRGSTPSSGPSTHTAAPGCGPLPPSPRPSRPCSCAATW